MGSLLCTLLTAVLVGTAAFEALTYLIWFYEKRRSGAFSATEDRLRLWTAGIGEWSALIAVVLMRPFGVLGRPKLSPQGTTRPVVLLHGWSHNRSSMAMIAARLRKDGRDAYAINYPSMISDNDRKAAVVAAEIKAIARATGADRVDVVGHSLGGVLARAAALCHGADDVIGNVVTLGSPHRGTAFALLFRSFGIVQLRPESRFLTRLLEIETDEESPSVPTVSIAAIGSNFDSVVFPLDCCFAPKAFGITVDGLGHHSLLFSERIYQLVKENLDAVASPPAPTADDNA